MLNSWLTINLLLFNKLFVLLFYQLDPLVLQWNFVADNIKLILSMSNVNIIVNIKMQPNYYLHSSNQTKKIYVYSVLCLLCLCARLLICALWSPAGKGLASWLSFVVSYCEFVTFPLVSWVRCGTWLYRFLIFAPLLTFTSNERTDQRNKPIWFWYLSQCWAMKAQVSLCICIGRLARAVADRIHKVECRLKTKF